MLITKTTELKIYSDNILYYINLGYNNIHRNDLILIPIEHLEKNSKNMVDVQCDECEKNYNISYLAYNKNIEEHDGKYICLKCINEKIKKVNKEKEELILADKSTDIEKFENNSLLTKNIEINITPKNLAYWRNKGYDVKCYTKHVVKTLDLPSHSKERVQVKCDYCKTIKFVGYATYLENIVGGRKYACSRKCAQEKLEETNLKIYGFKNPFQNEEIKNKSKETCIEKFETEYPMQNLNIQKKAKETNLKNLGVEYPMQSEKTKEKTRETCRNIYDVEWTSQIPHLYDEARKNSNVNKYFENTDLIYQSKHEFHFLKYCKKKNILQYIEKNLRFKYSTNGCDIHFFYPDFFIPLLNLVVEIKCQYTYDLNRDINLIKQKTAFECGFNFIFIIDKNYIEFDEYITKLINLVSTHTFNDKDVVKINLEKLINKHNFCILEKKPRIEYETKNCDTDKPIIIDESIETLSLVDLEYDFIYIKLEYTFKQTNHILIRKILKRIPLNKEDIKLLLKKFNYIYRTSNHHLLKKLADFAEIEYIPVAFSNIKSKIKRDERESEKDKKE